MRDDIISPTAPFVYVPQDLQRPWRASLTITGRTPVDYESPSTVNGGTDMP